MAIVVSPGGLTCFAFALAREHLYFRKQAGFTHSLDLSVRSWRGAPGILVETGIGAANVTRSLDVIAEHLHPNRLIFAGFAGALDERLRVGDVCAVSEVIDETGARYRPTLDLSGLPSAPLFTASQLLGEPADKRRVGELHGTAMVDMESSHFARWCTERKLPWTCVRAISDDVETRLSPDLLTLMSGGQVSVWRVVKALARRPSLLREMLRLARDTKHAARELARSLIGGESVVQA